ncbi:MAG: hypothetical protein LDL22_03420, partial [Hyphomicrobiales bacterium]|nr:hypothetical protein [Hyphomicrobiales bacterium]
PRGRAALAGAGAAAFIVMVSGAMIPTVMAGLSSEHRVRAWFPPRFPEQRSLLAQSMRRQTSLA